MGLSTKWSTVVPRKYIFTFTKNAETAGTCGWYRGCRGSRAVWADDGWDIFDLSVLDLSCGPFNLCVCVRLVDCKIEISLEITNG